MEVPSKKTTINILSELGNGDAWMQIMAENLALNEGGTEGEQVKAEMEAFANTSYALHDEDYIDRPVTIIGLGRTATDVTLRLMAVTGRYGALTSIPCDETLAQLTGVFSVSDETLAVYVQTGTKKSSEEYYFPLHPEALVCFEAEIVESDESHLTQYIKTAARQAQLTLRSSEFLGAVKYSQQLQAGALCRDLDEAIAHVGLTGDVTVRCSGYTMHSERANVYELTGPTRGSSEFAKQLSLLQDGRDKSFVPEQQTDTLHKISGSELRFIIPQTQEGWADTPVLELRDDEKNTRYWVPVHELRDITPTNFDTKEGVTPTIDLLAECFNDEWHEVAQDLANNLTYSEGFLSDKEWQSEYLDSIEILEKSFPENALLDGVIMTGMVEGEDGCEFIDELCSIDTVDFVLSDEGGKYHVIVRANVYDVETGQERSVFVTPKRSHLARCEALLNEENTPIDLVDELHKEAHTAHDIVHTTDFYKLPLDEQQEKLSAPAEAAMDHLSVLKEFFGECRISFNVRAYRCLPGALLDVVAWIDVPLEEANTDTAATPLSVTVDNVSVYNPEIDSTDRIMAFASVKEFPLSGGEPMLALEDKSTDRFYLARLRDVVDISPVLNTDEK